MKRRNFIKIGTAAGLALQFPEILGMCEGIGEIPRRILGKTGEKLSIVGFGGVALKNNGQEFANKLIPAAFNAGINYFDVSPRYGDAQERMVEKTEALTTLCRNTVPNVKPIAPRHLDGQLKSAWRGPSVDFSS